MTAQAALKDALCDLLGPAARSRGYKGSAPTFRKSSDVGDWAVVNVQSLSWSTSERLDCVVNLAFAPEPWLRWIREKSGKSGAGLPRQVSESFGLYRERLHPEGTQEGTHGWWEVSDAQSAHLAVEDINSELERAGWPILEEMFSRESMLARLRDGDLGEMKRSGSHLGVYFARADALMLMDDGPSEALESALHYALTHCMPTQHENAEQFDTWVRTEAAKA